MKFFLSTLHIAKICANITLLLFCILIIKISGIYKTDSLRKKLFLCVKFTLLRSGVIFVKIGQSLSLKPYIVGDEFAKVLASLQEQAFGRQKCFKNIKKIIHKDIIINNTKPISSGSIANVYVGKILHNGYYKPVAIKVVKFWLKDQTIIDLKVIAFIAKLLHKFAKFKKLDLPSIIQNIHQITINEFDMNLERQNCYKLKQFILLSSRNYDFRRQECFNFTIPHIYDEFCTNLVLVQEYIDAKSLNNITHLPQNIKAKIAKSVALLYLNQVYNDGCFHADLHSGNILFCEKSQILYLIDCGNISTICKKDRLAVAKILYYFIKRNYIKAAAEYANAGYISKTISVEFFAEALSKIPLNTHLNSDSSNNTTNISSILTSIIEITYKFDLKTQPQLLMLQKTILYVESCVYKIDKNFDIWLVIKPWMQQWAFKNAPIADKIKTITSNIIKLGMDFLKN